MLRVVIGYVLAHQLHWLQNLPMTTPTLFEMIQALVATPSVSSVNPRWDQSNRGVIDLLAEWLEALGLQVQVLPVAGTESKFNLVANIGSGPDGLVLSGHTDTVPYDEDRWRHDPFRVTEQDGRLYGLGTADMKSFFAFAIAALRELPLHRLRRPVTILATADEESSMCGARSLVEAQLRLGRHAVIGEPTGLRPVRLHKGIAMDAVRLTGRSGHSSDPALGISALEGMYRVMGEILAWRSELQAKHRNPLFRVDVPTLNLGHIHGGDNPNRICAACELQFDLRPLPGMDLDELRGQLALRLEKLLAGSGLGLELKPLFRGVPPMETPAGAAIVRAAEELTGHPAQAVAFATEGPFLNEMGMETVILGPGHIDQAHQPDEFIPREHFDPTLKLLRSLITRFCLKEAT
jgi:acetylornithine deacetylase